MNWVNVNYQYIISLQSKLFSLVEAMMKFIKPLITVEKWRLLQLTRRTVVFQETIEANSSKQLPRWKNLIPVICGQPLYWSAVRTLLFALHDQREVMVTKCTTERNNWQRVKDWTGHISEWSVLVGIPCDGCDDPINPTNCDYRWQVRNYNE